MAPLEKYYLKPGELIVAEEPVIISTVLGSCISVTMFDAGSGRAAICHAMLPRGGDGANFRYVDAAIHHMAGYFRKYGIAARDTEVKLFGGADMFAGSEENLSVGRQNVAMARQCLARYGMSARASDIGGREGRKVFFRTDNGVVYLRKLTCRDKEAVCI